MSSRRLQYKLLTGKVVLWKSTIVDSKKKKRIKKTEGITENYPYNRREWRSGLYVV